VQVVALTLRSAARATPTDPSDSTPREAEGRGAYRGPSGSLGNGGVADGGDEAAGGGGEGAGVAGGAAGAAAAEWAEGSSNSSALHAPLPAPEDELDYPHLLNKVGQGFAA